MSGVKAKWTGGAQFVATDEVGRAVVTDSEGEGFKPPDLLLASLVTCAGIDVVSILEKKRQDLTAIEATVNKTNAPEPPWTIEKIEVEWVITGRNLKEKAVRDAVALAQERYCSVFASLKSEIVTIIRLVEAGQEPRLGVE
jgi:putative redox protein